MSTEIFDSPDVNVLRFYGGDRRGVRGEGVEKAQRSARRAERSDS